MLMLNWAGSGASLLDFPGLCSSKPISSVGSRTGISSATVKTLSFLKRFMIPWFVARYLTVFENADSLFCKGAAAFGLE